MERHPTRHTPAWPKFSPFSATASFRRDFGHIARPIWHRLIISYGDIWKGQFTKQTTNHRRLESKLHQRNSGSDSGRTGKDFPKYGAPGSVLSGHKCWPLPARYDVVTFLTQRTYSCSNFVTISSLVLELLKKCRVRYVVGHFLNTLLTTFLFTQPSHSTPSWTENDLHLFRFVPVYQHALSFPVRFSRWGIESFYIVFPYSLKERVKQGYFSGRLKLHKTLLPK